MARPKLRQRGLAVLRRDAGVLLAHQIGSGDVLADAQSGRRFAGSVEAFAQAQPGAGALLHVVGDAVEIHSVALPWFW